MRELFKVADDYRETLIGQVTQIANPKGNVILVPNINRSIASYQVTTEFLVSQGFSVYGIDYYGQGLNLSEAQSKKNVFKKNAFRSYLAALDNLVATLRVSVVPTTIIGDKIGSFFVQRYIQKYDHIDRIILVDTDLATFKYKFLKYKTNFLVTKKNLEATNQSLYKSFVKTLPLLKEEPLTNSMYLNLIKPISKLCRRHSMKRIKHHTSIAIFGNKNNSKRLDRLYWKYRHFGIEHVEMHLFDDKQTDLFASTNNGFNEKLVSYLASPFGGGMHLVIHADYGGSYAGNFIPNIIEVAKTIKKNSGRVSFMFPAWQQNAQWLNLIEPHGKIYFYKKSLFSNNKILNRLIKKEYASVSYTNFVTAKTKLPILFNVLRHRITNFECRRDLTKKRFFFTWLNQKLYVKHFNYISVSHAVRNNFLEVYKKDSLVVIERVFFDRFKDVKMTQHTNKALSILSVGWNVYKKGFDILISALQQLHDEGQNISLNIASHDPKMIEQSIKDFCKLDQIPSFINFLPTTNNIGEYYLSNDITVFSSRYEGFCYAMVEAAGLGSVIIANDIPVLRELKIDKVVFYQKNDIASLQEKIVLVFTKLEEQKAIASSRATEVRDYYSNIDVGGQYFNILVRK